MRNFCYSASGASMDRTLTFDGFSDSQLLLAALAGSALLAGSGAWTLGEAATRGAELKRELSTAVETIKALGGVGGKPRSPPRIAIGAAPPPALVDAYRAVLRALTRWGRVSATPLLWAGSGLGATGAAALAFRLADAGLLTAGGAATTALPALLAAAALPVSLLRVQLPGATKVVALLRSSSGGGLTGAALLPAPLAVYVRTGLPGGATVQATADGVAARLRAVADAHPDAAAAVAAVADDARAVSASAWTAVPAAVAAGALGAAALLLLLAPRGLQLLLADGRRGGKL